MLSFTLTGEAWITSHRKRIFDLCALAVLTPFAAIIAAFACLLSALEHGWKYVFFTQQRIGQHGSLFNIHKIRTMHVGTAKDLTRSGELLNVLGADETPQLLYTIWSGNMTLIGPRPLIPQDFPRMRLVLGKRKYRQWYRAYIACRPGWMSMFSRTSRTYIAQSPAYFRARHYYDTYYHRHACFTLDVMTLTKSLTMWCTPPSRLFGALKRVLRRSS